MQCTVTAESDMISTWARLQNLMKLRRDNRAKKTYFSLICQLIPCGSSRLIGEDFAKEKPSKPDWFASYKIDIDGQLIQRRRLWERASVPKDGSNAIQWFLDVRGEHDERDVQLRSEDVVNKEKTKAAGKLRIEVWEHVENVLCRAVIDFGRAVPKNFRGVELYFTSSAM